MILVEFLRKVTKAGDVMDVTLDLENQTVDCKVNGQDVVASINKLEDGKYRLFASMWFDETELEIL